jgi:adenosylhomocysteine nucleosidase
MKLSGIVTSDRPLLVVALKEEAQFLDGDLPVLLTGIGKVNAAAALATVLGRGPLPASVINLGTAGALRPGWTGIHEVGTVLQHDLDTEMLRALTGETFGAPLTLAAEGPVLATGDVFVTGGVARDAIAARADLVDMEGYAVALVARQAGVPIRLVKHVSDDAGEGAAKTWRESVAESAQALADWTVKYLGSPHQGA